MKSFKLLYTIIALTLILTISALPALYVNNTFSYADENEEENTEINNGENTDTEHSEYESYLSYKYMIELENNHPHRSAGTQGELDAATYIAEYMEEYGYEPYGATGYFTEFNLDLSLTSYFSLEGTKSQSVIGIKRASTPTDKQVIIGAHYDNVSHYYLGGYRMGGTGAYNNASGIATMLSIAEMLQDESLPYNVVFIAFGAAQLGALGTLDYVNNMTDEEIENTYLMINLDSVAGADNIYIYTDEMPTVHEDFFIDNASADLNLMRAPEDKKITQHKLSFINMPYTHVGLMSSNTVFSEKGIITAAFLSLNWENDGNYGVRESSGREDIAGTDRDRLDIILGYYQEELFSRMDNLASSIVSVLDSNNFVSVMENSRDKKIDYSLYSGAYIKYINWGVKIAFLIVVFLIAAYLKKNNQYLNNEKPVDEHIIEDKKINVFEEF